MPKRFVYRVGRRGVVLLFLAMVSGIFGQALITRTPDTALYLFADHLLPLPVWGVLWLIVCLACLVFSFIPQDRVAFGAVLGLSVAWGLVGLGGWLAGAVPRGYISAALWLGVAALAMVVSTWPEPTRGR